MEANPSKEMPKYKCHKEVWALKIAGVGSLTNGQAKLFPVDSSYSPIDVDASYIIKHQPQAGGYYVVYADGYQSFSPAKAFEDGYERV